MNRKRLDCNIFLIGFMGAGKSTVARKLTEYLDVEYLEMDAELVREQGMPIADIFAKYGEAYFRDAESRMIETLQEKTGLLVSCGGGVVVRPENSALMKKNGIVVLLTARPETIYQRVRNSKDRPLLNGNMNVEYIAGLMEQRRQRYLDAADLIVETDGKDVETVCQEIILRLVEFKR